MPASNATPNLKPVLTFLKGLSRNNNRPWFEAHRADYQEARDLFEDFVQGVILGLGAFDDMRGVEPKDCIFRIHRDVRFSKDKSPYKTHMGAYMGPGGRNSRRLNYYVQLAPGGSIVAGGFHHPEPAQMRWFRSAIDRGAARFKSIVNERSFRRYFGDFDGDRLKTAPQGYDRSHPDIELLRLKVVVAAHPMTDAQVLSPGLTGHVLKACAAMKPFLDYLRAAA